MCVYMSVCVCGNMCAYVCVYVCACGEEPFPSWLLTSFRPPTFNLGLFLFGIFIFIFKCQSPTSFLDSLASSFNQMLPPLSEG